ncbi:MAG: AAA family ATPase [Vulcanimicrobiaceae bacterium]|jgi:hypothetical protein
MIIFAGWAESIGIALAAAAVTVLLMGGLGTYLSGFISRRAAERARKEARKEYEERLSFVFEQVEVDAPEVGSADSDIGYPPDDLLAAIKRGTCVLFVGHGISKYSTRVVLLTELMNRLSLQRAQEKAILAAARDISVDAAYETLIATSGRSAVVGTLERFSNEWEMRPDSELHNLLRRIAFEDCITTTYDETWSSLFANREPVTVDGSPDDDYYAAATPGRFSLSYVMGRAKSQSSVRLTWHELRTYVHANPTFGKFLGSLFQTSTVLFLGCSTSIIDGVFSSIPDLVEQRESDRRHFAVIAESKNLGLNTLRFRASYGIEIIPYSATQGHPELTAFLQRIVDALELGPAPATGRPKSSRAEPPRLSKLRLKNIGPFPYVAVSFERPWTIILGDNGSGKSTILRAIAVALASGEPAAASAAIGLRRSGSEKDDAFIELELGRQKYRVELTPGFDNVSLPQQLTPLRRGALLALGFPALRGISDAVIQGFIPPPATMAPGPNDVMALATNSPDRRLDDIRQWLINVDLRAAGGERWSPAEKERATAMRTSFFRILQDVAPYSKFEFSRVTKDPWRILINTNDGEILLEQVSQGMSSMLSWVGTLLERMYEVYDDSAEPEKEHALVLVDEIDAHLHPAWQRQLPGLFRKHFPNVSVIATTHSPLVMSALRDSQILIARREDGSPVINTIDIDDDMRVGMRPDQALRSDGFGLPTTRSPVYEQMQSDLDALIAKDDLNQEESTDKANLHKVLSRITVRESSIKDRSPEEDERLAEVARERPKELLEALASLDVEDNLNEHGVER